MILISLYYLLHHHSDMKYITFCCGILLEKSGEWADVFRHFIFYKTSFIFRETGREGGREEEKRGWASTLGYISPDCLSHTHSGMWQEVRPVPWEAVTFGFQASAQCTEPHQPRLGRHGYCRESGNRPLHWSGMSLAGDNLGMGILNLALW